MSVNLHTEHHLEFLSLTGGFTGSPESTPVKKPHSWKSHVAALLFWVLIEMGVFNTYKICVVFYVLLTATVIWSGEPQLKVSDKTGIISGIPGLQGIWVIL